MRQTKRITMLIGEDSGDEEIDLQPHRYIEQYPLHYVSRMVCFING